MLAPGSPVRDRDGKGFPSDLVKRTRAMLSAMDAAVVLEDLRFPPGNHLEALIYGPGMRWAFMGPTLGMHFTGGQGGIRGTIAHFGWSGPAGLEDAAVAAVDEMTRGHDVDALERWRDRNLVALLKALKPLEPSG